MKHYLVTLSPEWSRIVYVVEMENRELELGDFYNAIDGFIEIVPIPSMPGLKLVIDDCGKLKGLPLNFFASELAEFFPLDVIVGPALIVKEKGPELWPIDEFDFAKIQDVLATWGINYERD